MDLLTRHPVEAYLASDRSIEAENGDVRAQAAALRAESDVETARNVFRFVRDEVAHSWDVRSTRVTRSATDVLEHREGICYAKSHLAAALLRASGVPSGICYQRLTLLDDDSAGYAVHALNTVWLASQGRWIRFDARGNKPGVAAEFSLGAERLAFAIRPRYDEIDYLVNHPAPHPLIERTLAAHDDALEMYRRHLPSALPEADRPDLERMTADGCGNVANVPVCCRGRNTPGAWTLEIEDRSNPVFDGDHLVE